MAAIPEKIFKAYDIRGLYPQEINEDNIAQIITAIFAFYEQKLGNSKQISIVLGRDMRLSSPALSRIAQDTLVSLGAHVIDVGLVSTPTFYFSVFNYNYDAGIQITASHNPKDYNGIKFVLNTPKGLLKIGKPTGMEDVKKMAVDGINIDPTFDGKLSQKENVVDDEVENALSLLDHPTIKPFKIVADPGNAMAAVYIDALFKKIPGELTRMNFELDGTFPVHQPDPMQPSNLVDIKKKVLEEKADIGLAPDGDGDRLFIIDEKGETVSPSFITSMIAKELFEKYPKEKVVVDQKYILSAKRNIEGMGGQVIPCKTGHAYITETLTIEEGLFAGEASAHYYYKATGNAESQVITIAAILKIMTEENKPLSEIAEEFRKSYESGEINFAVTNANEIMDVLKNKYHDGELSIMDGIAITYPTWRFGIRSSNTEPLLRFNIEADDKKTMEEKRDEIGAIIKQTAVEDTTVHH